MPLRMGQVPENCSQVIRSAKPSLTYFHSDVLFSLDMYCFPFSMYFWLFGYNERLVSHPLPEDACILVVAASDTSMLEPDREDHAQGTQRPTQSPTQSRHRGVASPSSGCYHVPSTFSCSPPWRSRRDAALAQRRQRT